MRDAACQAWLDLAEKEDFVFLTGDLGFMSLEPLAKKAGSRFINAGVAEQNMISVAAGLAKLQFKPWVYSIAPFAYARPFEQIRNDVCLHQMPVKVVGNGGGFGYGVMGATHHAIEDYGVMLALQGMKVYVPAFREDVRACVQSANELPGPCYLRLGRSEKPATMANFDYAPVRKIVDGKKGILLVVGPLAGTYIEPLQKKAVQDRPALWVITELPMNLANMPAELVSEIKKAEKITVCEEHVAQGSFSQHFASDLLKSGIAPKVFQTFNVQGYHGKQYGSQAFHRGENNILFANIESSL
jgi:transketolase